MKKLHWLDYAEEAYGTKLVAETKKVLNVLKVFLSLPLFWALYGQINSRWIFQASKMDGNLGWYTIKPDQMVITVTIFIIVLIPTFNEFVFPLLKKIGIITSLQKIICGFACSAISFVVASIVEWQIEGDRINMLWLIPQYLLIATSEVFIWVSILSFAFTQAPSNMKSVMTALIYLTVAGGSFIVVVISSANFLGSQFNEYLFYVFLMIGNSTFLWSLSKRYQFEENKN